MSPLASAKSVDNAAVDKAIASLKTYDYGTDRNTLKPIDEAVIASYGNTSARKELEGKLVAVLGENVSRDAKDYCCRILRVIGSADCVPTLASLLSDKELSHSVRYALQSIPDPAAGKALREALPKSSGALKVGIIGSLGARRDVEAVAAMAECLTDTDKAIVKAAAHALGAIGTVEASKALTDFAPKVGEQQGGHRRPPRMRRAVGERRQKVGGLRHLQIAERRRAAQARPPRRQARHVSGAKGRLMAMTPTPIQQQPLPRRGCALQPRVAAVRGYPGKRQRPDASTPKGLRPMATGATPMGLNSLPHFPNPG